MLQLYAKRCESALKRQRFHSLPDKIWGVLEGCFLICCVGVVFLYELFTAAFWQRGRKKMKQTGCSFQVVWRALWIDAQVLLRKDLCWQKSLECGSACQLLSAVVNFARGGALLCQYLVKKLHSSSAFWWMRTLAFKFSKYFTSPHILQHLCLSPGRREVSYR